jgi:hypothetical protein
MRHSVEVAAFELQLSNRAFGEVLTFF